MKNEKGITLIALVITIIVMLILVTVTIRVATDGNLFTHAANAAKGTKSAIADENAILDGNIGNKTIESIVAEQTGIIHFTIEETEYIAEKGMTWEKWIEIPTYNEDGYKISDNKVVTSDESKTVVMKMGKAGYVNVLPDDGIALQSGVHFYLQSN